MRKVRVDEGYSIRTEEAYVDWARRFILFHGKRHPKDMGEEEVRGFLSHLAAGFWRGGEVSLPDALAAK